MRIKRIEYELTRLGNALYDFDALLSKALTRKFMVKKTTRKMYYSLNEKDISLEQLKEQFDEFTYAIEKIESAIETNMSTEGKYSKRHADTLDKLMHKGPRMVKGEIPAVSQIVYKLEWIEEKINKVEEGMTYVNDDDTNNEESEKPAASTIGGAKISSGPLGAMFQQLGKQPPAQASAAQPAQQQEQKQKQQQQQQQQVPLTGSLFGGPAKKRLF